MTDDRFRIVILGDFGGRGERGSVRGRDALVNGRPLAVDRDDVDAVMARLAPAVRDPLAADGSALIHFAELEDFHPDRLHERLPAFRALRELRRRLADPRTAGAAEREL